MYFRATPMKDLECEYENLLNDVFLDASRLPLNILLPPSRPSSSLSLLPVFPPPLAVARRRADHGRVRLHVLQGPHGGHVPLEGGERVHHRGGGHPEPTAGHEGRGGVRRGSTRYAPLLDSSPFLKRIHKTALDGNWVAPVGTGTPNPGSVNALLYQRERDP